MKCPVCEEALSSQFVELNNGEVKTCMTCFFEPIPNLSSFKGKSLEEKRDKRSKAIESRAKEITKKYCK